MSFYITEDQAQTRPDGSLDIQISGELLNEVLEAHSDRLIQLTLEATITDESGLPVSARRSIWLHPSAYYIGVQPEQWSVSSGEEITYSVRTIDWQGNPVPRKPLTARFSKVSWVAEESEAETSCAASLPMLRPLSGGRESDAQDIVDARAKATFI